MALPVYATFLANLKGPQGEEGRPGTFDVASAEVVASDQPAEAVISGEFGEQVHFKVPRGLPGVNAVENDAAVAAYVAAPESDTRTAVAAAVDEDGATAIADTGSAVRTALHDLFEVVLMWNGSSYPTRVPGARNRFRGPVDPGLLMDPAVDVWEPGDATSLDAVAAALADSGSPVYAAAQLAMAGSRVPLQLQTVSGATIVRETIGSSPSRLMGWKFPPSVNSLAWATAPVPVGWNDIRVRVRWMHNTVAGAGNVRLGVEITPYAPAGAAPVGTQPQSTRPLIDPGIVNEHVFSGTNLVTPGGGITVGVARFGGSGLDTFTGDIWILEATLERQA